MADHKREIIEREAGGLPKGADDGALLVRGFPGQLVRPAGTILAVLSPALAPLANGLSAHAEAFGQHARGLRRARDLDADSWGGAGLRVDGQHHVLLR
nr:hypothetical protein [Microvirga sp. VF16]